MDLRVMSEETYREEKDSSFWGGCCCAIIALLLLIALLSDDGSDLALAGLLLSERAAPWKK